MHLRDEIRTRARLLHILLAVLVICSGCREALSADEVLDAGVRIPIHCLNPNADTSYKELDATYYYFDDSEVRLVTYFTTENSKGQMVRIARMSTCLNCGQLVNVDETRGLPPAPITWAKGTGGTCRAHPPAYRDDWITGDPFRSCLYWMDENGIQYKLYTVWSEEEAVNFANALIVFEKDNE